jgi:hypothetical protein
MAKKDEKKPLPKKASGSASGASKKITPFKADRLAAKKVEKAKEQGVGATVGKDGKVTRGADPLKKARAEKRATNKAVAGVSLKDANDKQDVKIDAARERIVDRKIKRFDKNHPGAGNPMDPTAKPLPEKAQKKAERLTARKGRIDARQERRGREAAPPPPATPEEPVTPPANPSGPDPARLAMERYVRLAGFPVSFVDDIMRARGQSLLDDNSEIEDYIGVAVNSGNQEFATRFPSIVNQWKKREAGDMSVQIMAPNQVLEYEKTLQNAADDYGLSSWVSSPDQIARLIDNDVSAEEAVERIDQAGFAATVAPQQFRDAFFKQYGLTEGNLVGFFLDPDREEGEIQKAVAQGRIVAAGMQNGFANNWEIGKRLFDKGVTGDNAMSGFSRAALTSNLSSGLGATVSEDTRIDAAFDDAKATEDLTRVSAQRTARFNSTGGASESRTGVTGLGSASV